MTKRWENGNPLNSRKGKKNKDVIFSLKGRKSTSLEKKIIHFSPWYETFSHIITKIRNATQNSILKCSWTHNGKTAILIKQLTNCLFVCGLCVLTLQADVLHNKLASVLRQKFFFDIFVNWGEDVQFRKWKTDATFCRHVSAVHF